MSGFSKAPNWWRRATRYLSSKFGRAQDRVAHAAPVWFLLQLHHVVPLALILSAIGSMISIQGQPERQLTHAAYAFGAEDQSLALEYDEALAEFLLSCRATVDCHNNGVLNSNAVLHLLDLARDLNLQGCQVVELDRSMPLRGQDPIQCLGPESVSSLMLVTILGLFLWFGSLAIFLFFALLRLRDMLPRSASRITVYRPLLVFVLMVAAPPFATFATYAFQHGRIAPAAVGNYAAVGAAVSLVAASLAVADARTFGHQRMYTLAATIFAMIGGILTFGVLLELNRQRDAAVSLVVIEVLAFLILIGLLIAAFQPRFRQSWVALGFIVARFVVLMLVPIVAFVGMNALTIAPSSLGVFGTMLETLATAFIVVPVLEKQLV